MKIGLCGTGKMGAAMAERLMGVGHELTVWNRTRERAGPTIDKGATWADSPAALAGASEAVIVMVYDDAAAESVYQGAGGLAGADLAGKLVIEMSTVRPETVRQLGELVESKGGRFVECPVGGTVQPAREAGNHAPREAVRSQLLEHRVPGDVQQHRVGERLREHDVGGIEEHQRLAEALPGADDLEHLLHALRRGEGELDLAVHHDVEPGAGVAALHDRLALVEVKRHRGGGDAVELGRPHLGEDRQVREERLRLDLRRAFRGGGSFGHLRARVPQTRGRPLI